jgi:hypothetical protein
MDRDGERVMVVALFGRIGFSTPDITRLPFAGCEKITITVEATSGRVMEGHVGRQPGPFESETSTEVDFSIATDGHIGDHQAVLRLCCRVKHFLALEVKKASVSGSRA